MVPILYSFRRCPYAMRARLAIVATGASVALREVKLRDKPAAMLDVSAKGTVPVLVLPDGSVIDESLEIMRWAFASAGRTAWLDDSDAALVATNDGAFKYHLDRYKYADRYGVEPCAHRDAATGFLARLDEILRGRAHLGDCATSPVDLAIIPFVRQFAQTDRAYFDGLPLPGLHAWLARHVSSRLFARIMVRLEPWQPGDAPIVFPTEPPPP
ncbi:glutathione S-transferase [Sphingomonas sp. PB2P12]|uniref:glutathione S-transferase n=1 Tax=Sphingomonas sandaracina TaxID=3096157 RepID=UPI002FC8DB35